MRAFASLYAELDASTSIRSKVAAMRRHFLAVPAEDAAWAVYFLAGARPRRLSLRSQLLTDPHSPDAARGALPERNIDAWYKAFDVQPGDKYYLAPEDRVRIW